MNTNSVVEAHEIAFADYKDVLNTFESCLKRKNELKVRWVLDKGDQVLFKELQIAKGEDAVMKQEVARLREDWQDHLKEKSAAHGGINGARDKRSDASDYRGEAGSKRLEMDGVVTAGAIERASHVVIEQVIQPATTESLCFLLLSPIALTWYLRSCHSQHP